MKYLILHNGIDHSSFLNASLHLDSFSELQVGNKSYCFLLLDQLPYFNDTKILYTNSPLESSKQIYDFLSSNRVDVSQYAKEAVIIYYDLRYFPTEAETLDNILQKAHYSNYPVTFFNQTTDGNKTAIPIFKTNLKYLLINMKEDTYYIADDSDATPVDLTNIIVDLMNPSKFLELFASNFQARHFNTIKSEGYFFIKSSPNKGKMAAEHNFLKNVPSELMPFFPQVCCYYDEPKSASYQIEKIFMLDASKSLINKVLFDKNRLRNFMNRIEDYLNLCPVKDVSPDAFKQVMRSLFVDKPNQRLGETKKLDLFDKLNHICVKQGFQSVEDVHDKIISRITDYINKTKETTLVFSHGDLCFSNILYDINTTQMKLIDPRGIAENMEASYFPVWYDLAKLSHSFLGLYDLILYDMIDILLTDNIDFDIKYQLPDEYLKLLRREFCQFLERTGYSISMVRLFEASLFISMIPLHRDNSKRMTAQLLQAISSFRAYQEEG